MANFNQPYCDDCWIKRCEERGEPDRVATRLKDPREEQCCQCGENTRSGIYVRQHPNEVPYPSE